MHTYYGRTLDQAAEGERRAIVNVKQKRKVVNPVASTKIANPVDTVTVSPSSQKGKGSQVVDTLDYSSNTNNKNKTNKNEKAI